MFQTEGNKGLSKTCSHSYQTLKCFGCQVYSCDSLV